jgi:predicted nuclease of predicted toxin-antitoxin system
MRFLFDQSTDRRLAPILREAGHEVAVVGVDYPASLPDGEVLATAQREGRVLVTEDRDFGELVFKRRQPHCGVIFLRLPPMELAAKIDRLKHVLANLAGELDQFIVVTERSARVRRTDA